MESIHQAIKCLSALAQESRLEAFRLLVRAGEQGMSAGDISDQLGIPPATLSFHLKELATTGLVQQTRHGRSIIYAIDANVIAALMDFLTQDCCQGRPELCQLEQRPNCREDAC
ncbi:ArsR/SmtB family transcription factor [Calycomorphotria hydatis]|uniref:Helix-turn-helix domain protein n=1 Tax=Calycomorphotria hydatis TaxID=2528027 RepID=A0A517TF70_9PLAN|nr:metalloregulator ArsR/SmtB family transcription factor [Calycomorphotria hydatis]QDT67020.1 Helix-turn-helix domain protein [Calycomorphotria hydatis]